MQIVLSCPIMPLPSQIIGNCYNPHLNTVQVLSTSLERNVLPVDVHAERQLCGRSFNNAVQLEQLVSNAGLRLFQYSPGTLKLFC